MELQLNHNNPDVMHIDLNSCFATVEQQAYFHLRGKPIVVSAYITPNGCVLSPSIEAKRYGIKTGMTNWQAKLLCKDVIIRPNDPPKVRDVHIKFKKIFKEYSPHVYPKSIDEAVIHFEGLESFLKRPLTEIAEEIKHRMRTEIGEWISCSIGIATNITEMAQLQVEEQGLPNSQGQVFLDIFFSVASEDGYSFICSQQQSTHEARNSFLRRRYAVHQSIDHENRDIQ
jgi:DNA polymerase-4